MIRKKCEILVVISDGTPLRLGKSCELSLTEASSISDGFNIHCGIKVLLLKALVICFISISIGFIWAGSLYAESNNRIHFSIPAGSLADALDIFAEQSQLQVVYVLDSIISERTESLDDTLFPEEVLDKLIDSSELSWRFINGNTVLIASENAGLDRSFSQVNIPSDFSGGGIVSLNDIFVHSDPRRILPFQLSTIGKPLLETPRSISVISEESIDLFGLSAVEDLVRVVPGVYTTTRFGIQGAIDVRNVSADTFVRGMKRVNLQGHGRSVLGAMDTIEIVRGPPSPLMGMGKIGGYTNVLPKSGRARLGGYLLEPKGFAQSIIGAYNRTELSFGVGGPATIGAKNGGYYIYGLLEDSDSYTKHVRVGQKVFQAALSVDDVLGPMRLEAGLNYQRSTTSGALLNRVTQELIDERRYISGQPLVNLDLNSNGKIGFLEMHQASPVRGLVSTSNQPLNQRWDWPTDEQGEFLPLNQFPTIPGIPQSLYDYLNDHPEADPGGELRAQGVGGPLPQSGYVPIGFALDPRTVTYSDLNPRRSGAFEREVQADFGLAYFDLIYDSDPNLSFRNQFFYDSMDQYKWSEQPGGGKQDVQVMENKTTLGMLLPLRPQWVKVNSQFAVNFRNTHATGYRYVGDHGTHRTDAMFGTGKMTPNSTFVHPFENDDIHNDGAPWVSDYRSDYWEVGAGVLLDIDVWERTNVLLGGRVDRSRAKNIEYAGTLDQFSGTSESPGVWRTEDASSRGYDSGASWTVSLSHQLPSNLRPYMTSARSSVLLESNNNRMPNPVIEHGHIGQAQLHEVGLKGSLLEERLFFSSAIYNQRRMGVSDEDDIAIHNAAVSSTKTRGWETEIKWVPLPNMFVSLYGLQQETQFVPNLGRNILVDARTLGFEDVTDSEGRVIFPAEAFLYGGRSFIEVPDGIDELRIKQGNPETQLGMNGHYQLRNGLGATLSANYFSSVYSGRLRQVRLPSSQVYNFGLFYDASFWHIKLDVYNLFNKSYYRPRIGDNLGETLVSPMPDRRWQLTFRVNY